MFATWFLASSAMLLAPDAVTLRATIIGYGPNPGVPSGVLKVLRPVDVAMLDGSRQRLYFIHAGGDEFLGRNGQAYPLIGSTCDFSSVAEHISRDELGNGCPDTPVGNVIVDIHCSNVAKPD